MPVLEWRRLHTQLPLSPKSWVWGKHSEGSETELGANTCTITSSVLRAFTHLSLSFFLCKVVEKAMAPHSSTLAWKIPWTEEPGRLQSMGLLESDTTERLHFHFSLSCTGEGNGNPLQCSCLQNPRDGEAWWAAVYGVAQSQTQQK